MSIEMAMDTAAYARPIRKRKGVIVWISCMELVLYEYDTENNPEMMTAPMTNHGRFLKVSQPNRMHAPTENSFMKRMVSRACGKYIRQTQRYSTAVIVFFHRREEPYGIPDRRRMHKTFGRVEEIECAHKTASVLT